MFVVSYSQLRQSHRVYTVIIRVYIFPMSKKGSVGFLNALAHSPCNYLCTPYILHTTRGDLLPHLYIFIAQIKYALKLSLFHKKRWIFQ
jgi:hypothetical protein